MITILNIDDATGEDLDKRLQQVSQVRQAAVVDIVATLGCSEKIAQRVLRRLPGWPVRTALAHEAWQLLKNEDRERYVRSRYGGLTGAQRTDILARQGNKCAICRIPLIQFGTGKDKACVDHCHSTGRVRGILCGQCNTGLGMFKDSRRALRRAEKYLENHLVQWSK